jgi:glutaconate CoA-transferase subunit A
MHSKLVDLKTAIATHVNGGDSVILGAGLETAIPFCATHELIRQGKRRLNMVAPISDASTDMLIGAGCVAEVTGAWIGNVSGGLGHNYRRAAEKGAPNVIKIHDHSNFSLGMALLAGGYGMPYAPLRSLLGSDILKSNPDFKTTENPFVPGEPIVLAPPLKPDVAIFCVQRADAGGNSHYWGSSGVMQEAAFAAERIILIADEIVDAKVIASDPSRCMIPGFRVTAVCQVEGGCHPAPLTGRWKRDNDFFNNYHARSRDADGFQAWLQEWVLDCVDPTAYRAKLASKTEELRIAGEALAAPANYAAD